MRRISAFIKTASLLSLSVFLVACNGNPIFPNSKYPDEGLPAIEYSMEDILMPEQPGIKTYEDNGYLIDYSNASLGYLSIKAPLSDAILKAQILVGDKTFTYDLISETFVVVPLQEGDGTYTVRLLKNIEGYSYSVTASTKIDVTIEDANSPFLYPNQIVDYTPETLAVLKSFELTQDAQSEIERVFEVYQFVIDTIDYDYDKAKLAKTTYMLPVLDETYTSEKGICFDYSALMTAMLRVLHIPTKVVTGITDLGYHAWVEIYIKDQGWINPSIYFNSEEWKRVDPTFDSMGSYEGSYQTKDTY